MLCRTFLRSFSNVIDYKYWRRPWCWEGLGAEGDDRGCGWMASPTPWTGVWVNSGSLWWTGVVCCDSWGHRGSDMTERLNWILPSVGKESTCNAGDPDLIPGPGRFPGEGKGYPLQYSGTENSMDCKVHVVTKSWTQLCDFHN